MTESPLSQSPSVLHIGWMPRAVAALRRAGADITCVVAPQDAEAARAVGAGVVVVPRPADVEDVCAGLARHDITLSDYTVICSVLEFCLVPAAVFARLAGGGGDAVFRALAMRDKFVQKRLVREAGVPTADCEVLESLESLNVEDMVFPRVLKPLNGGGARHTFVLTDEPDVIHRMAEARTAGKGPWLLEEFVDGAEFQVDGIVRDGALEVLSVSRYVQNLVEVHAGGLVAHTALRPADHPDLHARIESVTERSLKALGYQDGPFHLEVFEEAESERIVFGECAARVGGGRTDDVVELAFGVNLRDEWASALLGRPSRLRVRPSYTDEAVYGGMNLPAPAGRIEALPSLAEILARPGVMRAELDVTAGELMPDVTAASHLRAGLAVVAGRDERETVARMRDLADWFRDRVVTFPDDSA